MFGGLAKLRIMNLELFQNTDEIVGVTAKPGFLEGIVRNLRCLEEGGQDIPEYICGTTSVCRGAYDTLERVAEVVKARRGYGDVSIMLQLMPTSRPILLLADFVGR